MRLFLLSILAIGGVHSLTVGYPYRSALLAYSPGRGEFPVQSTEVQRYLRYFDNNGVEHVVSYSHPEPTLAVRQVPGVVAPVVRAYNVDPATYTRAIEGHFRAWIAVQHKALTDLINGLRAQGKEPSADMLLRLQPIEKIYHTADFSTIADQTEFKLLFNEHSRLYKVKTELLQKPLGELKTYTDGTYAALVPVQETPEQKKAREEHLHIFNQQVAYLRQLEAQKAQAITESSMKTQNDQPKIDQSKIDQPKIEETNLDQTEPINRLAPNTDGLTEVERATQEHLRIWNEARLRAEESNSQYQFRLWIAEQYKTLKEDVDSLRSRGAQPSGEMLIRLQIFERIYRTQDFATIAQLPEVKRLYEEFSRIYRVKLEIQHEPQGEINTYYSTMYVPLQPVGETPEQKRAREEHLRIHSEQVAYLRKLEEQLKESQNEPSAKYENDQIKSAELQSAEGITEVERATQEHLRLWNEARLNAERTNLQSESEVKDNVQTQVTAEKTQFIQEPAEILKARAEHLKLANEAAQQVHYAAQVVSAEPQSNVQIKSLIPVEQVQQQQVIQSGVVDTPEVQRAREEHLRLVNEAKIRAQSVEQEEVNYKKLDDKPLLTNIHSSSDATIPAGTPADTPEVVKAREEHLRIVSQAAQQNIQPLEQSQEVNQEHIHIAETPEVTKARQEHLRIFNEIKSHAEQEQAKILELKASGIDLKSPDASEESAKTQEQESPSEEAKQLEIERVREAERLLEEQKQLEMEQTREKKRLAAEKLQMEAELMRLKLEEEQRLEMEKLIESRRLKDDQEQDRQFIITEEYKPIEDPILRAMYINNPFLNKFNTKSQNEQQQLGQQSVLQAQQQQQQTFIPQQPNFILQQQQQPFISLPQQQQPISSPPQQQEPIILPQQQQQSIILPQQQLQQAVNPGENYANNPFLSGVTPIASQSIVPQPKPFVQLQQVPIVFPSEARKIQSSPNSIATKQQHIKQDYIKGTSLDNASFLPADTAAILIHHEKARQEHFRAHDLALEQLRLARIQNSANKDCN